FPRYVFLIWLGAFFPIFVATLVGVPRVEPIHKNVAKVHGAGRWYVLRKVVVPSVLPDILGGMRVGMGTAWMTIVAAEMSGGETTGLGRMMVNYAELIRIPEIVVGMILIGVLGFAMNEVLLRIGLQIKRVPTPELERRVAEMIELVGLRGFEAYYPYQISGGMKQRVAIARAFAVDADLILMDEPFAALDEQTRHGMQAEVLR